MFLTCRVRVRILLSLQANFYYFLLLLPFLKSKFYTSEKLKSGISDGLLNRGQMGSNPSLEALHILWRRIETEFIRLISLLRKHIDGLNPSAATFYNMHQWQSLVIASDFQSDGLRFESELVLKF